MWILRHPISVFMTKFQTDFTPSVWSFCHWVADVPCRETSPSGNEQGGRSLFAGWVIEQLRCPFCFTLLLFPINVVMGYQGFNKVLSRWQKLWRRWRCFCFLHLFLGQSRGIPPPPPGKFMKSRRLRIHFKHSGAKIRVFEQNTDILNFRFFFLSDSRWISFFWVTAVPVFIYFLLPIATVWTIGCFSVCF